VSHGYKGKGSLIHLLADGKGRPLATTTTGAGGNERTEVEKLLQKTTILPKPCLAERMVVLEADKGYDCSWLRQALLSRGIFPFIPYRKIRGRDIPQSKEVMKTFHLEKKRWQIERAFSWLKRRGTRLMNRWERKKVIWDGFVTLGLIYTWMLNLVG
jgi:transposase